MAFEPGTGVRAQRHDGHVGLSRFVDCCLYEVPADTATTQGCRNLGVHKH
jgi:hypothetical protein